MLITRARRRSLAGWLTSADSSATSRWGQTYQVVRRMDGMIVRQWVSPNSPLVYQIPWSIVNTQFTVPVGVDPVDPAGRPEWLRGPAGAALSMAATTGSSATQAWASGDTFRTSRRCRRSATFWCDVTAADSEFFNRITIGAPHPASDQPARSDYPQLLHRVG